MAPIIREATAADLAAFYGKAPARTVRAMVAVLGDDPIAVCGLAYQGGGLPLLLFSEMKPEMRRFPKMILKGARAALALARGVSAVAVANPDEALSPKLLRHLGFVPSGRCDRGEVFAWRN